MKIYLLILAFSCFSATAVELTPVKIINSILISKNVIKDTKKWYQSIDASTSFNRQLEVYGAITANHCNLNHDSKIFNTVTCHITQEKLKNGSIWEFYFFLDNGKWVGTTLGKVQDLPQDNCIAEITFLKGIGKGVNFLLARC